MARGRDYEYAYVDRAREAQDDWYLQRRREIGEDDFVQTQLEISEPGDAHEQEADKIASTVVNGGNAKVNTHASASSVLPSGGGTEIADAGFKTSLESSKGGGNSLDESTRSEMESKMGADFSDVKIHTDSQAGTMSKNINAKAFTHGQDIYFNQGNYNPNSSEGKELLAHELVHTVQQSDGKIQPKIQRQVAHPPNLVPNEGNTALTGDDRGAMGYLPNESDFANAHKNDSVTTKVKIITDALNYKNSSDPTAKSFWEKFKALNEKKGPNGVLLVQTFWEQALKIKAKSDQAVKDIDAAGNSKRAALEGLYVRSFTSRKKPYEKKSADWGHWKEYEPGKYNKVPYDHIDNPLFTYSKNKFHGFGSMMVLDDHYSGTYNATTSALLMLQEKLTDEKKFIKHAEILLGADAGAKYFAALMSALRDISTLVDKVTAAKAASEKTGLPLHYMLALYGQEGNFTMPASYASLQAGIPVTERGGLSMVRGGTLFDFSPGNLVLKAGGNPKLNKLKALNIYRLQIAGLDIINSEIEKATAGVTLVDDYVDKSLGAMAKWSFDNRTALKNDKAADKTEISHTLIELKALWTAQYNGLQQTDKKHRKATPTNILDDAVVFSPLDPEKLTAFILTEAGLYFKRTINSGITTGGVGIAFTPEVAYLMYNVTGIPNKGKTLSFITQTVQAAFKLTQGKPSGTPPGKLGIPPKLLTEVKTIGVAKAEDITTSIVQGWLNPERWKLIMEYLPLAGQDELRLKQGNNDKFQNQINMSNFSTLAKFYKDVFKVQKKSLDISQSNDPDEKEADEVARKVGNGQNADLTGVQRFFSGVQRKEKEEEAPLDLVDSLDSASGGRSMDENTRTEMESKMGVDFGGVKIHTGSEADTYNQQVNAKAFTYGQDIYFRNGQYNTHSKAGKELLAHELVHTVQQSGSLQRKIQRSPLTPKKFADTHFKDVTGYSWATLQQILKSDGSKEQDENLEILLSALINQNPQLNAQQLWTQLELDPTQLKGFTSASMYAGGTDQLPQFTRTTGSLKTEADLDSGMNELKTGTVEYTRRKHFIFGKKKKEAKRKAASEQATAFIQQKAGQVDAVITTANDSKHLLETDLQNLASGLNVKLVADAQAKEQQVFAMIATIRPDAEKAKYDFRRFYHGSLTVIDNNTEDQKAKLSLYVQETIRQINELHSTQVDEIKKLYDAFNANVKELAGGFSDQAIGKGGERYNKIETENTTDSQLLKKGKQRAVVNESQEASNEINILAGNTMKDATGLDGMEMITNPDLFGSSEEYESELTQQNAIMNIYNQQAETEMLLDGRAEADKKKALDLWYLYNDKVDQQAVQIIETLTASLQLYYEKLNAFGTLQDEAINAFYTKSVAELNTASQDQVQQSKLRLEQFKTSQQGLKTPRKKKLQEQQDLVSADVDPLVAQANANVKKVNDERALALTQLDKTIQNGFDALALQGTTDFTAQISALSTEFAATRQKGIDEQLDLRVVHLRQIIRDVKSSKQQMDEQVTITKDIYAEQLVTLDADLTTRLEEFKTEANAIIDGLDKRMDDAEEQAELDELSGALQREQNVIDFREANIKLMGTEDCYALYKQYKSLTHQHKKGAKGKKIRKELEALLARHGLEPKLESYGRLIGSFTQGFKLTVSATALSMVKVFEDTLNSAEKDYSNIQNVEQLFKDLAPFRATTVEATKYEKIANDYAQSTQPKKSVPGTDIMGPGKQLNADEQAEYDYAYAKVATANVVGREQLRPLYGKHPIFDDENLLIQYRTPKSAIGNAKDAKELQSILLTYIADRKKDISTARANIISEEGSNDVFGMDKAVEQVYTQFSIAKDTVQDKILTKEINTYKSNQIALAVVMAILSIALAIITFGEGVPFIVSAWAAAGMLALDAYYIIDSVAQYEKEKGFAGAGIISSDPSMIWIFLAVAGAVLDVASLFKSLKIVQVAAQEFSATGDVSKFEKAMADAVELQGLNAKLANKITLAARMRTGYNEAAANFYRLSMTRLRTGIDPSAVAEMVKMAYYSMREGLATFEQFVILIKRSWVQKGLMASMDEAFTPEELAAVKKAWQEAAGDVEQGVVKVEQKVVTVIIKESEELLDQGLIQELKNLGTKFSEADLKFICKDVDGKILFLEKGNSGAGLQHIIERHWNPKELMKYFSDQEEMIQKIFSTLKNDKYITKEIVMRNGKEGLEYTYKMSVKGGERTFKIGVGSNGYVVTFYPQ